MPLARFFGLLQIFIAGRDLRVGIIACLRAVTHRQVREFKGMRHYAGRRIMAAGFPQTEVLQDLLDNWFIRLKRTWFDVEP